MTKVIRFVGILVALIACNTNARADLYIGSEMDFFLFASNVFGGTKDYDGETVYLTCDLTIPEDFPLKTERKS